MQGDIEARLATAEAYINALLSKVDSLQAAVDKLTSDVQQLGYGNPSPMGGGGNSNLFVMTPSGGIPALTGTSAPYTPGIATCEVWKFDGTHIVDAGYTVSIRNSVPLAVGGSRLLQAKTLNSALFVDVDPCTWPPNA